LVKILDLTKSSHAKSLLADKLLSEDLIASFEADYAQNSPLAFQTERGIFEYENHPVLSKANLNLAYQELEVNGHLHLILLGEKYSAGDKKFEETRGLVIRDFQEYLDGELIEELRKKYPITVNTKAKEEAFISLNQ
jgi:peptidyl-prolyl cis-trans isomerase SurA